jgi:hypothetical protein
VDDIPVEITQSAQASLFSPQNQSTLWMNVPFTNANPLRGEGGTLNA